MIANFSDILNNTQTTSNAKPLLKPWEIHHVRFVEAVKANVQGKSDPTKNYDILRVKFENENGYYTESIFYPHDGDDTRQTYPNANGGETVRPSRFEQTMTLIAQIADVLNHDGFVNMQKASSKFKSFDDVVTAFIKITTPAKGKETNIKLVGTTRDGKVLPASPRVCAISSKTGEKFTCNNFIGENLFFTPYETGQRNTYMNAKPTNMSENNLDFDSVDTTTIEDGDPFDDLLK